MILNFQSIQTYIINTFALYAASGTPLFPRPLITIKKPNPNYVPLTPFFTQMGVLALAAVSCFHSLTGFGFLLFAPAIYNALGYGKGDTILVAFAIIIGCPV